MARIRTVASLIAIIISAASCSSDSTGVKSSRPVIISFANSSFISAPSAFAYAVTVTGGGNTVVITRAQVVLRDIELKQSTSATCTPSKSDDGCEEVKLGPVLVDLPLTAGVLSPLSADIPAGTYREIEFEIHKPGGDASDKAFSASNPAFANISVLVEGTYNGKAFTFSSAVTQDMELEFNPPIVVDATAKNITLQVDVASWFKGTVGTVIDPATANPGQPNASRVDANIKASFRAVEDDDKDGK